MKYSFNLVKETQKIYPLKLFNGQNKNLKIGATNYYLTFNDKPVIPIMAECHYSRIEEFRFEDEIIKMKLNGVNIISTYLFWIHHEEIEGEFDFKGSNNIKKFLSLCAKHKMKVILRIGPFCHGEVRNGGLPDWLLSKPFDVRSTNKEFLYYVERLFKRYYQEVKNYLFDNDGPVIAIQIDNEYMHSSAPWEITNGTTNEWVNAGYDKEAYMDAIIKIAKKCKLIAPIYTATAWGGAIVSKNMMPLWGGYAYRPWIFYSYKGKHPLTTEYLYQDFHHDGVKCTNDFIPSYLPHEYPYLCCEMGGGGMSSYYYRFIFPYEAVDAMSNIKLASGCNMLGYYMFHGGVNPVSKLGVYLNENQVPKVNYDFNAPLSMYGDIRLSYKRLKAIHYFLNYYGHELATYETYVDKKQLLINPKDKNTLRYSIRSNGESGFVFFNNFQDHDKRLNQHFDFNLKVNNQLIKYNDVYLPKDENLILPFNLKMDHLHLINSNAQLVSKVNDTYIFLSLDKDHTYFNFKEKIRINKSKDIYEVKYKNKTIYLLVLSRAEMNNLYLYNNDIILTSDTLLIKDNHYVINSESNSIKFKIYKNHKFIERKLTKNKVNLSVNVKQNGLGHYILNISDISKLEDAKLNINYIGDVAYLYLGNRLINDNFSNNDTWSVNLKGYVNDIAKYKRLVLNITPIKEGLKINSETAMAARSESYKSVKLKLNSIKLSPIYTFDLSTLVD